MTAEKPSDTFNQLSKAFLDKKVSPEGISVLVEGAADKVLEKCKRAVTEYGARIEKIESAPNGVLLLTAAKAWSLSLHAHQFRIVIQGAEGGRSMVFVGCRFTSMAFDPTGWGRKVMRNTVSKISASIGSIPLEPQ
jgi:hypothetical protein